VLNGVDPRPGLADELTPREQEVLRLVARGLSNREIAAELVLGEETVKSHVGSILGKLGLAGRAQVASAALRLGLIRPDEV
jgi:DNA-binding NarL/FixJ family response regulator